MERVKDRGDFLEYGKLLFDASQTPAGRRTHKKWIIYNLIGGSLIFPLLWWEIYAILYGSRTNYFVEIFILPWFFLIGAIAFIVAISTGHLKIYENGIVAPIRWFSDTFRLKKETFIEFSNIKEIYLNEMIFHNEFNSFLPSLPYITIVLKKPKFGKLCAILKENIEDLNEFTKIIKNKTNVITERGLTLKGVLYPKYKTHGK